LLEDIDGIHPVFSIARRIQESLASPFDLAGHVVITTASIGIILSTEHYDQPEDYLRDADTAMYRAKAKGGATFEIFNRHMREQITARLALEGELRQAIKEHGFRLFYQPIIDLNSNKLVGFEALIRWQNPKLGLLLPGEFISVAEETGLIVPIGEWVLREAIYQVKAWQTTYPSDPPLTVSVNISALQLMQSDLVEYITQVLRETGFTSQCLNLEVTESAIIQDMEKAIDNLKRITELGVGVHMDDFGTGYSSLSYLNLFPIGAIKIDRSYIAQLQENGSHSTLVRTMLIMARELGLKVTAEGIELKEQLARLNALGCNYGQGFLFSKPQDSMEAEKLLKARLT